MSRTIALLTDFGIQDIYVGVMKGVMRDIYPEAHFIDITHQIPAQSVRAGAVALANSYSYFPEGTVFLVVVDPGVGSTRRPIAVTAGEYSFIAPDNGVLTYALRHYKDIQASALENSVYRLDRVSNTFHGRDVFAPAAAYLARGDVGLRDLGQMLDSDSLFRLPDPQIRMEAGYILGEITHIDHFGNIITSIGPLRWVDDERIILDVTNQGTLMRVRPQNAIVQILGEELKGISSAYHMVPLGSLLAQIDSNGFLEIAVNHGSAAERLDATVGDQIKLHIT